MTRFHEVSPSLFFTQINTCPSPSCETFISCKGTDLERGGSGVCVCICTLVSYQMCWRIWIANGAPWRAPPATARASGITSGRRMERAPASVSTTTSRPLSISITSMTSLAVLPPQVRFANIWSTCRRNSPWPNLAEVVILAHGIDIHTWCQASFWLCGEWFEAIDSG